MTKMNNRGFLLTESLIVSTFVLTVLIFLFAQFKNIIINYKTSYIYNSVEDIYSLGALAEYLKTYENIENPLNTQLENKMEQDKSYFYIYENGSCTNEFDLKPGTPKTICNTLGNEIGLEYVIYTNSDLTKLSTNNLDADTKNFIKRIDATEIENKGRLIAKFNNGHYATIAMNVAKQKLTPLLKSFNLNNENPSNNITLMTGSGKSQDFVTEIEFVDSINIPNDSINWDVSEANNGSVMAWLDGTKLYIGGEGGVIANPNSGYIFANFINATSINMTHYITNDENYKITNMQYMFSNCKALTKIDLSNFDKANVNNMQFMFSECKKLKTIIFGDGWKNSNAETNDMQYMFYKCAQLSEISFENFHTSNVTNMSHMFFGCTNIRDLDLSSFNTENVTDMQYMFTNCYALRTLIISNFNTEKVVDMNRMFQECFTLETLNLNSFNTKSVTNMESMFHNCSELITIYAKSDFKTTNVEQGKSTNMFAGCTKLSGPFTAFDSNITDKEYARIDTATTPGYFTDG